MNSEEPLKQKKEKGGFWKTFFITLIIALSIRFFIAQPFIVNGQSMEPTFENGEYLIVDELTYRFREPERGEVIIFRYPKKPSKYFIKRIIGLPEETLEIDTGIISITDSSGETTVLDESYIDYEISGNHQIVLGMNEYFVMGDNRNVSSDSRAWGPVTDDLIIGRAVFRFLPITEFGVLPGDFSEEFIK